MRFEPGIAGTAASLIAHLRGGGKTKKRLPVVDGLEVVELRVGMSVDQALAAYNAMPGVRYAEPNYLVKTTATPNDALYPVTQWGLNNTGQTIYGVAGTADADMDAPEAWDLTQGSNEVIVAVVDTGVDYRHWDLAANMWVNEAEASGIPGVDDDGNGFVDDIYGADTYNNDGDPLDDHGHGTHCAGSIGAEGDNGIGVAGVNWDVSVMALKFMSYSGVGPIADAIEAFGYARDHGATVISNSWGSWREYSAAEHDAMAAMSDVLFVCAAGNQGKDIDSSWPGGDMGGYTVPAKPTWYFYPAAYDLPNILTVGASTNRDAAAPFSNYGDVAVDLFAPGEYIASTYLGKSVIAPDAIESQVFFDGFDVSGLGGWSIYSYGQSWSLHTDAYTSAPNSAGVAGYVNDVDTYIDQIGSLDLSGADYPALRFRVRYDTERDYDFFFWGVYDPVTGAFPNLGMKSGAGGDQFVEVVNDLRAYAGRDDIALWFGFSSDGSVSSAQGYDGVWLDDVEVVDLDTGPSGSPWTMDYTNAYAYMSGTSMATPYVAGLAGLLLARNEALSVADIKGALMQGADVKSALAGTSVTGARANAFGAILTANRAPDTVADEYSMSQDSALTKGAALGVLANDSDVEGDSFTAAVSVNPANGNLMLEPDGGFTYTPDAGWTGTEVFEYTAFDGIGYSASTLVTVTVLDTSPPMTLAVVDPASPDGEGGWYKAPPTITLSSEPGATTYYFWGTYAPAAYTVPLTAPEGESTLTFYSTDAAANEETPRQTLAFKVDTAAPGVPVVEAVPLSASQVRITWPAVTDVGSSGTKRYVVYRNGTPIKTIAGSPFTDSGLAPSTSYRYRVEAVDNAGNSGAKSPEVTATTLAPPADTTAPNAPTGLTATASGTSSIVLAWTASSDPSGIAKYKVYRSDGTLVAEVPGTVRTYTALNLVPSTSYAFIVRAVDTPGNVSAPSNTASATTLSVPITLVPIYRFYSPRSGTHFYTPSAEERDMVIATWPDVWSFEGVAYSVNPVTNPQPLYRFFNRVSASHFYTASVAEAEFVIATWPHIFTYEGETYRVSPAPVAGATAVYRFYNLANGSHFYTASAEEADHVIVTWPHIYQFEGPAFWLAP